MDNPMKLPKPDDPIQQIHDLARDIAYGAINKIWTSHLRVTNVTNEGIIVDAGLNQGLQEKWGDFQNYYSVHLLTSFGYLVRSSDPEQIYGSVPVVFYDLTPKAFALLEKPSTPPSVFISYKRDHQSSALGLYIEARLKLVGNMNPFIDKNINAGEVWQGELESKIRASQNFVCLIASKTLISPWVQQEIDWSLDAHVRIIAIWHDGYTGKAKNDEEREYLKKLENLQRIRVEGNSADAYEIAANKLLNSLGYQTY